MKLEGYELFENEAQRGPWLRLLFGQPVDLYEVPPAHDDQRLGFVETGPDAVDFVVNSVQDGRNVMLVGPRGTGKSYMAGQAVKKIVANSALGRVAVITIQGDPNKPPSDYFDDAIVFRLVDGANGSQRVLPQTVDAPLFQHARRDEEGFYFETSEGNDIVLQIEDEFKHLAAVDRVVIFWDEGNRSSPAMQNATLGLLAERTIRRDGRDYRFPPVSCILTRNPDGYDSGSAKMPSPLVDRFGAQLFVYSPSIDTMVDIIAKVWLVEYESDLVEELARAFARLAEFRDPKAKYLSAGLRTKLDRRFSFIPQLQELVEAYREEEKRRGGRGPRALNPIHEQIEMVRAAAGEANEIRWFLTVGDKFDAQHLDELLVSVDQLAKTLGEELGSLVQKPLKDSVNDPRSPDPVVGVQSILESVRAEVLSRIPDGDAQRRRNVEEAFDVFGESVPQGSNGGEGTPRLSLQRACIHLRETLHRVSSLPTYEEIRPSAQLFALVILGSWGDSRSPADKPGMQYIPNSMRGLLVKLAQLDRNMERALRRLGDRTRYGTSIRAYVDMLQTLVGESTRRHSESGRAKVDLELMRPHLGRLLNHRCEPAFNPDREPARARQKTEALIDIADGILYRHPTECRKILEEGHAKADSS